MEEEFEFRHEKDSGVPPEVESLARAVLGAAIEVHRILGPGLPESVYRKALSEELTLRNIVHVCEATVPVYYKGKLVGEGFVDVLVGDAIVFELKTVEDFHPVHRAQVIAYLQALQLKLGFLINFNVSILRDGIKRVVNKHLK
jgi:GxxExxY protein